MLNFLMNRLQRMASRENLAELNSLDNFELEVRQKELGDIWQQINKLFSEAAETGVTTVQELQEMLSAAERRYFRIAAALHANKTEYSSMSMPSTDNCVEYKAMIPSQNVVINTWGIFEGDILQWQSFRNNFAVVHEDGKVEPAVKFEHLKGALKGEAALVTGIYKETPVNYCKVWARLEQVYGCKYALARALLDKFFGLKKMETANEKELVQLCNTTLEIFRQMGNQGFQGTDLANILITYILSKKLDLETARQWKKNRQSVNPPWKIMIEFLEQQAAELANDVIGKTDMQTAQETAIELSAKVEKIDVGRHTCDLCKQDKHPLHRCRTFQGMNVRTRTSYVLIKRLCRNCLRPGHKMDDCFGMACPRCNGQKHNSLLCPVGISKYDRI